MIWDLQDQIRERSAKLFWIGGRFFVFCVWSNMGTIGIVHIRTVCTQGTLFSRKAVFFWRKNDLEKFWGKFGTIGNSTIVSSEFQSSVFAAYTNLGFVPAVCVSISLGGDLGSDKKSLNLVWRLSPHSGVPSLTNRSHYPFWEFPTASLLLSDVHTYVGII